MIVSAENLPDSALVKFFQHFLSQLSLDVEVVFALVGALEEPGNVLEYDGMNGAEIFRLLELVRDPAFLLPPPPLPVNTFLQYLLI